MLKSGLKHQKKKGCEYASDPKKPSFFVEEGKASAKGKKAEWVKASLCPKPINLPTTTRSSGKKLPATAISTKIDKRYGVSSSSL